MIRISKTNGRKARQWAEHGGTARCIAFSLSRLLMPIMLAMIELATIGSAFMLPSLMYGRTLATQNVMGFAAPNVPIVCASRSEPIGDILLNNVNAAYIQPNGNVLPSDRFMFGVNLQWEGRITNAASNNPTGVQADQPFALVDTVTIQGYHRIRKNQETFIVLRGPEIYELAKIYQTVAPYWVNAPSSGGSATSLSTTASATNDARFSLPILFVPECMPINKQIQYLLDAPNYDRLTMVVNFADDQNVFTYGTRTASTFTAFGSASGNPRIRITGLFAQAGPTLFANFVPGRVFRTVLENTTGDIVNTVAKSRQFNLDKGYLDRSFLIKTGVKSTAVNAGNNSYNSLSDTIYANITIYRGQNKLIRQWVDMFSLKQTDAAIKFSVLPDKGYALIEFAPHGVPAECLDTTGLVAGPTGDVDLFLQADTTGAANQAALCVQQVLRFTPSKAA